MVGRCWKLSLGTSLALGGLRLGSSSLAGYRKDLNITYESLSGDEYYVVPVCQFFCLKLARQMGVMCSSNSGRVCAISQDVCIIEVGPVQNQTQTSHASGNRAA